MLGILLTQDCLLYWNAPVYSKALVKNAYATIGLGVVELIALVLEHRRLAQYGKSVGKAFGYEELTLILFTEFYGYVLAVGGASFADVYGYIKHFTTHAAEELALSFE